MTIATQPAHAGPAPRRRIRPVAPAFGGTDLDAAMRGILSRHPAVGFALGVVADGRLAFFGGHGRANLATRTPVGEDTVFRIGSITKLFTAIAVLQLVERGLVELDAPAERYLRAYRLVAASPALRPPTVRHLLTHTAGIPEVRGIRDLLRSSISPSGGRPAALSVPAGEPLPTLEAYYRDGLRYVVAPGTVFAYSNHGFATLGQIVEDVSRLPLPTYLRDHVLEPLGMTHSDLGRTQRVVPNLATGYALKRDGPHPVPDRDWIGAGAGGLFASMRDVARFADSVLRGGANDHGRVLEPSTVAMMFEPQFQPDPRIPGMGLAFFRYEIGGHRVIGHDGILPAFDSALLLAPDDRVGVVALTNGSSGAFAWLQLELPRLLGDLIGARTPAGGDVAQRPDLWSVLCGRYVLPARVSDMRIRLVSPRGLEVFVRGGRLMLRLLTPVPGLGRALALEPDGADPLAFRLDLEALGMAPTRVVFSAAAGRATALHTDFGGQPLSLERASDGRGSVGTLGAVGLGAAALAAVAASRRARRRGAGRRSACPSTA